jgi:hypothetical protein
MRLVVGAFLCIAIMAVAACHTDAVHRQNQLQKELLQKTQKMHETYLTGGLDDARQSLRETIRVMEESEGISPSFRAANLFVECSRLYVLEESSGNETAAKAAFVEVRYWYLQQHELNGDSPLKAMDALEAFSTNDVVQMIKHENSARGKAPNWENKLENRVLNL